MATDNEAFASPKRLPFAEKKISALGSSDSRVRILGTVIDSRDNVAVIDDGTGRINVTFEDAVKAEMNATVRVFGRVLPSESGFEMQGEFLQDMSHIDLRLYQKVVDLESKL